MTRRTYYRKHSVFSYIRRSVGGWYASGLEKERCWELLPGGVTEGGNRAPDQGRAPTYHLPGRGGEGEPQSLPLMLKVILTF